MGESIGIGDVSQAIAVGGKLTVRAEQFKTDLLAKVGEITAKHQPSLFPKPGDEFSQGFSDKYLKDAHALADVMVKPSNATASNIGDSMVDVGTYVTDTFVDVWNVDQQNSHNVGSV